MTYPGDWKVFSPERANRQFKAARPRLQLILSGHRRGQWIEMRRYDRAALLGNSMQEREIAQGIPTPSGGEQGHVGWLRRFKDQNLE